MAAVTRNVAMVTPMILPARLTLFILAMAEAMEQNTIGTTTQNIMLMNSVPRNLILPPKVGGERAHQTAGHDAGDHEDQESVSLEERLGTVCLGHKCNTPSA